ncbi:MULTISPECIES: hypothetical protein [Pseudomonas]|nr:MULTISPECIES: hypothetical protein [Pseudomonas]
MTVPCCYRLATMRERGTLGQQETAAEQRNTRPFIGTTYSSDNNKQFD